MCVCIIYYTNRGIIIPELLTYSNNNDDIKKVKNQIKNEKLQLNATSFQIKVK